MYAIKLLLTKDSDAWKPGMITIIKQDGNATTGYFPCYLWVTTDAIIREAKGTQLNRTTHSSFANRDFSYVAISRRRQGRKVGQIETGRNRRVEDGSSVARLVRPSRLSGLSRSR